MSIDFSLSPTTPRMVEIISGVATSKGAQFTPDQLQFITSSLAAMNWELVNFDDKIQCRKAVALVEAAIEGYMEFGPSPLVANVFQTLFENEFGV